MSTVDIAEGRRLLAAATPGPWERLAGDEGRRLASEPLRVLGFEPVVVRIESVKHHADAALIVWLRNNAEALLAGTPDLDVELLARALERVREDTEGWGNWNEQVPAGWRFRQYAESLIEVLRRLREAPDGPCPVCAHFGHGTADHGLTPVREAPDGR